MWPDSDIPNYKPCICLGYGLEEKHKAHITSLLKSVLPMTIRLGRLELISINNSENDHKWLVQQVHSDGFSTCHNLLRNHTERAKPFIFIESLNKKCGDPLLSLLKQHTSQNAKSGIVNTLTFPIDEPIWPKSATTSLT